jgi:two-component system response regulator PilR (NtrC family)
MSNKRILLVEDDPDVRDLLGIELREAGYLLDTAGTVPDAMDHLDSTSYALAIVDWQLPGGNGLLVADTAAVMGARTIVMSGYLVQMPGGRADGHETIMKPFELNEFLDAVKRAIGDAN